MAHTKAMQRLLTLCGTIYSDVPIIQAQEGWLDGLDFKEAVLDVLILRHDDSAPGLQVLYLETAISPEGPWTAIATYNTAGYQHHQEYFSTASGATDKFQRFIRWRLDISDTDLNDWYTCFRICAVLK
jgi:hypothetical protein